MGDQHSPVPTSTAAIRDIQTISLLTISTTLAVHVQPSIFSSLDMGTKSFWAAFDVRPCTFKKKPSHVASFS